MTMLVINAIEVSYASDVEYSIDEDTADIEVRAYGALPGNSEDFAKQYAISGLIQAYYLQLVICSRITTNILTLRKPRINTPQRVNQNTNGGNYDVKAQLAVFCT